MAVRHAQPFSDGLDVQTETCRLTVTSRASVKASESLVSTRAAWKGKGGSAHAAKLKLSSERQRIREHARLHADDAHLSHNHHAHLQKAGRTRSQNGDSLALTRATTVTHTQPPLQADAWDQ